MRVAAGVLFVLLMLVLSYPLAKNFQLCGYKLGYYFKHAYVLPYEFKGKSRLVFTKRMTRFVIFYTIFVCLVTIPYFILIQPYWWIFILAAAEFGLMTMLVWLCGVILFPLEEIIKLFYIKKACKKLKNFKGIKIAITGSFGKTSTKNFLAYILRTKFKVCATPKNFNTPMGLCKTVLENLRPEDEIMIAEMGAKKCGDIATLMKMFEPTYGILTAVGEQHLESFGSLENIKKTKFELCEHMRKGGVIVFDGASDNTKSLFDHYAGKKILANLPDGFANAESVSCSSLGTRINLRIGQTLVKTRTEVLGNMLICDIVLAASMASALGMSEAEIAAAIKTLKPSPHRLQLLKTPSCTVIDDAYNSNLDGAKQACECLKLFKGKRVIVTPGFVEQGAKQYELNYFFGKIAGQSCDELVIMNQVNKTALSKGALSGGLEKGHIHYASTRNQQMEILKSLGGKVVLFENDLPDNFR